MSEPFTPRHTAYTAKELVDCGWVARARGAVVAGGTAVRVGSLCIEAQNANRPEEWLAIQLPNGGTQLTDFTECLLVADMLQGITPIPVPESP